MVYKFNHPIRFSFLNNNKTMHTEMFDPNNEKSMDIEEKKCFICDIWEENDNILFKLISLQNDQRDVMIHVMKGVKETFYFSMNGWNEEKYTKQGFMAKKTRHFTGGYHKEPNLLCGVLTCNPSQKQSYLKRIPFGAKKFNSNIDVITQYTNNIGLSVFDRVTYGFGLEKCHSETQQDDSELIKSMEIYSIYVEIEESTVRPGEPISNWDYKAEQYGHDPLEVCDETTQRIVSISVQKYHPTEKIAGIVFKHVSELVTIEMFMEYFESLEIDMLLCWKYEYALEYIKERYVGLGNDENDFRKRIFRTTKHIKLSVEYLEFDSPVSYQYVSVFYIYYHIGGDKCKGGYTEKRISEYYFGNKESIVSGNDLICKLFTKQQYFAWMVGVSKFFRFDFRTMLDSYSRRLLRYLYRYCKDEFVFTSDFISFAKTGGKKDSIVGGKVLTSVEKHIVIENVFHMDITRTYPSIIEQFNICPTTYTHSPIFIYEYSIEVGEVDLKRKLEPRTVYFVPPTEYEGIYPRVCTELGNERLKLQKLQKEYHIDSMEYNQYGLLADLFKVFANGLYGIGNSHTCFYCPDVAESITLSCRRIFNTMIENFTKFSVKIDGGDTDGWMGRGEIENIHVACQQISKEYPKIKVKVEEPFERILFIGSKNYYARRGTQYIVKGGIGMGKDMCILTKKVCELLGRTIAFGTYEKETFDSLVKRVQCIIRSATEDDLVDDNYHFGEFKYIKHKKENLFETETIPKMKQLLSILFNGDNMVVNTFIDNLYDK